jgi:hypothetical protein
MSNDDLSINNDEGAAEEQARLWRLFRFVMALMAFYLLLIFLDYEHETILMILGAGCFMLWILYMLCMIILLGCSSSQPLEAEERGLTMNNQEEDHPASSSDVFSFSFAKTPRQIRSYPDPITPGVSPSNGYYEIVYNAIVFGKTVRSQGKLKLQFEAEKNGWSISGSSETVSGSRTISEGFVNSIGHMYWIINEGGEDRCMYRGVFEISSSTMWGGDFQSTGGNTKANGRIVRLEKINDDGMIDSSIASPKNSSQTQLVEMVTLTEERNEFV